MIYYPYIRHVITEKHIISQSMNPPAVLVAVSVFLIVLFTDSGFINPVNGQKVITGDNIKIKDCSKYIFGTLK